MATVYLIDASPYIFRAYYSLPPTIKTPAGMQVNAVYGYADFLIQILKENPTHIAVAFDGGLTTSFRNEIYPAYKAQRALPPPELEAQLEACVKVTEAMGMSVFIDDQFEADDIIGTIIGQFLQDGHQAVVVSSDKDLAQLVNDRVVFWNFAKREKYDVEAVIEKFGVRPEQIADLLALMGDSVDNIPGVEGIGPKTAQALLSRYGTLNAIYENLGGIATLDIRGASAIQRKLSEHRDMAFLSRKLTIISMQAPVQVDIDAFRYGGASREMIDPLFQDLGFSDIQNRIPQWL
ncbi:MAG: 5'-3' exonuclease H3TH domain-containing protein [bacterium]